MEFFDSASLLSSDSSSGDNATPADGAELQEQAGGSEPETSEPLPLPLLTMISTDEVPQLFTADVDVDPALLAVDPRGEETTSGDDDGQFWLCVEPITPATEEGWTDEVWTEEEPSLLDSDPSLGDLDVDSGVALEGRPFNPDAADPDQTDEAGSLPDDIPTGGIDPVPCWLPVPEGGGEERPLGAIPIHWTRDITSPILYTMRGPALLGEVEDPNGDPQDGDPVPDGLTDGFDDVVPSWTSDTAEGPDGGGERPLGGIDWTTGIAYSTLNPPTGPQILRDGDEPDADAQDGGAVLDGPADDQGDEGVVWTFDMPENPDGDGETSVEPDPEDGSIRWTLFGGDDEEEGGSDESDGSNSSSGDEHHGRGSDEPQPWERGALGDDDSDGTDPSQEDPSTPDDPVVVLDKSGGPGAAQLPLWSNQFRVTEAVVTAPGSGLATASRKRDWLTGGDTEATQFQFSKQRHSLLGPRGARTFDVIDGFSGGSDALVAPANIVTEEITVLAGESAGLRRRFLREVLDGETLAPDTAVAIHSDHFQGTFVVFNDSQAGFQASSDALVFLRHYTFAPITIV